MEYLCINRTKEIKFGNRNYSVDEIRAEMLVQPMLPPRKPPATHRWVLFSGTIEGICLSGRLRFPYSPESLQVLLVKLSERHAVFDRVLLQAVGIPLNMYAKIISLRLVCDM